MTRLFTDGAEMGDILFWTSGNPAVTTSNVRSGTYAYRTSVNDGGGIKYFTSASEVYFRLGSYYDAGSDNLNMCGLKNNSTEIFKIYANFDGFLNVYIGASLKATGTHYYFHQTYYLIEAYLKIHTSGIIQVKMDGVLDINFSGDTTGAGGSVNNFWFNSGAHLGYYPYHYVDDLALNDASGSYDNSWCGDGHIEKIIPNGAGTVNEFSNSGSTAGSNNYTYVDDFPSDSDTSYVYASGSSTGNQDRYAMSAFSGTGKTITRVYSEARIRKTIADDTNIRIGYVPNGGSEVFSGSVTLTIAYDDIVGTSGSTNPVTGLAWTTDDVNALEYVVEI